MKFLCSPTQTVLESGSRTVFSVKRQKYLLNSFKKLNLAEIWTMTNRDASVAEDAWSRDYQEKGDGDAHNVASAVFGQYANEEDGAVVDHNSTSLRSPAAPAPKNLSLLRGPIEKRFPEISLCSYDESHLKFYERPSFLFVKILELTSESRCADTTSHNYSFSPKNL